MFDYALTQKFLFSINLKCINDDDFVLQYNKENHCNIKNEAFLMCYETSSCRNLSFFNLNLRRCVIFFDQL